MSEKYQVRYLPAAENDLLEIFRYIKEDDTEAAIALMQKINSNISNLKIFPHMGANPKDRHLVKLGYKMLVVDNYLVFYVVKEEIVKIRRVIHSGRSYSSFDWAQ